jgi:hypothetical protein
MRQHEFSDKQLDEDLSSIASSLASQFNNWFTSLFSSKKSSGSGSVTWSSSADQRVKPEVISKLNLLASQINIPFTITSGYRSPNRNAAAGGAKKSAHLSGSAVDIKFPGDEATTNEVIKLASSVGFGGIGIYRAGSLHLDILGRRAWGGDYHAGSIPGWASKLASAHMSGQLGQSNQGIVA